MHRFILGTAGHVDHGKTTLVKALTGVDTDRLPEEKARGISIELGFAPLPLRSDVFFGVVDVPGHERFIKTMVAGATGIDALLLVISAEEGIAEQTREHVEICELLGVRHAICALTKSDRVSPEILRQRVSEIFEFLRNTSLRNSSIVPVSVLENRGLDDLRAELLSMGLRLPPPADDGILMLPIDRVFSSAGFGTIVTGTLVSGTLHQGEKVTAGPDAEIYTIRAMQVFKEAQPLVRAKSRVAINLPGIERRELTRGDVLYRTSELAPTARIFASLEWIRDKELTKVRHLRFMSGTTDVSCRLKVREDSKYPAFAEITLTAPIPLRCGEHFILRTESPPQTLTGGEVLDPLPSRPFDVEHVEELAKSSSRQRLLIWIEDSLASLSVADLARRISKPYTEVEKILESEIQSTRLRKVGADRVISVRRFLAILDTMKNILVKETGLPVGEVMSEKLAHNDSKVAQAAFHEMIRRGDAILEFGRVRLSSSRPVENHPFIARVEASGLEPPLVDELARETNERSDTVRSLLASASVRGRLVRVSDDYYCGRKAVGTAYEKIQNYFQDHPTLTMSDWKEAIGISRKFAVPLLEYFDREKITLCRPDRSRIPGPKLQK